MTRYLINFSYDGTNYNGYQKQKGLNTIQGKMEEALKQINNKTTKLSSSGRTDAFVHALNQYAHADIDVNITEYKLKRALNSLLPEDIHVNYTKVVDNDFHARYSAKKKQYIYKINIGEYNPIEKNYIYQLGKELNIQKMKEALKYLRGTHDFDKLSSNEHEEKNTIRTIYNATIKKQGNYITLSFIGNGFLKYMVRIIVGILIQIGLDNYEPIEIKNILDGKGRKNYKKIAPAQGLYLYDVYY